MSQFTKKPKFEELYAQTFHSRVSWVSEAKLPQTLPFLTRGSVVKHINMKAIGRCKLDGVEYEFADVRIYVTPPPEESPAHVERAIASEGGQGG